jgi:hypothetical protein
VRGSTVPHPGIAASKTLTNIIGKRKCSIAESGFPQTPRFLAKKLSLLRRFEPELVPPEFGMWDALCNLLHFRASE